MEQRSVLVLIFKALLLKYSYFLFLHSWVLCAKDYGWPKDMLFKKTECQRASSPRRICNHKTYRTQYHRCDHNKIQHLIKHFIHLIYYKIPLKSCLSGFKYDIFLFPGTCMSRHITFTHKELLYYIIILYIYTCIYLLYFISLHWLDNMVRSPKEWIV